VRRKTKAQGIGGVGESISKRGEDEGQRPEVEVEVD